jgi:phosphoribosylanthranilate isomerase
MSDLKLKVCGMREAENVQALVGLMPDFIGMIFYEKSPRCIDNPDVAKIIPASIKKVGVFVNADLGDILDKIKTYQLDFVQLHGDETPEIASQLKTKGIGVIKVFSVVTELPIAEMKPFEGIVDYFLFDTKTPAYGGSGHKFDWQILKQYDSTTPFFLSGGIDLDDLNEVKSLALPQLYAIDVNSRFEIRPGFKDIEKLNALKNEL